MAKYQFFCKPTSNRKEFTFLDMSSETFIDEKTQLLELGFEVEDDVIYAETSSEAVEKFRSNFISATEEYANSHPEGGLAIFIIESFKALNGNKFK